MKKSLVRNRLLPKYLKWNSENIAMLREFVQRERIFEFLTSLNIEFDQVEFKSWERKIYHPLFE